jgi:hypothetical protein
MLRSVGEAPAIAGTMGRVLGKTAVNSVSVPGAASKAGACKSDRSCRLPPD